MSILTIEQDFKTKVCDALQIVSEGMHRYRVLTPFVFEDGDHLGIVLKQENERWLLTDEGNTFMRLTYDIDEEDLRRGNRQKIISNALSAFDVRERDGELISEITEDRYGDALYSYVQALLKISDVSFLSREQVRSTFTDDVRQMLQEFVPGELLKPNWHDPTRDREKHYVVDYRIEQSNRPIFVFSLTSDEKVRDATITLYQFEKWKLAFQAIGVFEDQEKIARKPLAQFSDISHKQFSSLSAARDRLPQFLAMSA